MEIIEIMFWVSTIFFVAFVFFFRRNLKRIEEEILRLRNLPKSNPIPFPDDFWVNEQPHFYPKQQQLESLGWKFNIMGAEGPYYDKGIFRLQIVGQSKKMRSVYNLNKKIPGLQNLHIYTINIPNKFPTLFYGYCSDIKEFKMICSLLKI